MKLHRKQTPVNRGSALVITLILCTIMGTLVGSYLYLIGTQHRSVVRSQNWHQALVVAEAGVEETMAFMNSGVQSNNFKMSSWWTQVGTGNTGVFKNATNRPGCKFGNSYYDITITNAFTGGTNPVIIAKGFVPGPVGSRVLLRTLRVETRPRPTFPVKGPMIVFQSFNANGNNTGTDSFDSSVGPYNPLSHGTNGDVISLSTNANALAIGNGNIVGTVHTPPGGVQGVTATIGASGAVGDTAWVAGSTGFESGHFKDDFTLVDFPDATLPNVTPWLPPISGVAPDGTNYNYLLGSGNWSIDNLTGSVYVGQPNTVVYVTSSINIGGNANIHIAVGGSLTIYMAGATTAINGNGIANDTGLAKNFAYYGLPGNTSITITGNGTFYGTIYAPEADLTLKGGGKSANEDFTGAAVVKSTTMTGNFNFHYDESLSRVTTLGGYDVVSWSEL